MLTMGKIIIENIPDGAVKQVAQVLEALKECEFKKALRDEDLGHSAKVQQWNIIPEQEVVEPGLYNDPEQGIYAVWGGMRINLIMVFPHGEFLEDGSTGPFRLIGPEYLQEAMTIGGHNHIEDHPKAKEIDEAIYYYVPNEDWAVRHHQTNETWVKYLDKNVV